MIKQLELNFPTTLIKYGTLDYIKRVKCPFGLTYDRIDYKVNYLDKNSIIKVGSKACVEKCFYHISFDKNLKEVECGLLK